MPEIENNEEISVIKARDGEMDPDDDNDEIILKDHYVSDHDITQTK